MSTAIEKATSQLPEWSREEVDLLKKNVCPQGCTDAEFNLFLMQCKRTGLDPFIKQAWMMERSVQTANGNWVKKFEFQAAESGVAAKVDLFPDYKGTQGAAVYEGDEILINESEGTVHHAYNPLKRGKLIGAWAKTHRIGRFTKVSWLTLESRIQRKKDGSPIKMWATDPAGQMAKCARMDSYRNAYPNHFEKVYADGELPEVEQADDTTTPTQLSGVEALRDRLGVKPDAPKTTVKAEPVVVWGDHKGTKISALSDSQMNGLIDEANQLLPGLEADPKRKQYAPAMKRCLLALEAEVERRAAPAPIVDAEWSVELEPNEPGAEG